MLMYTVPTARVSAMAPSSVTMRSCEIGQALPTVPGCASQSLGVARVPPPSDAA